MSFLLFLVLLTWSSPPASLNQNSVLVQPWWATQRDLPQSQTFQIIHFMGHNTHHQVHQDQHSTHDCHHHVTYRPRWLQVTHKWSKKNLLMTPFTVIACLMYIFSRTVLWHTGGSRTTAPGWTNKLAPNMVRCLVRQCTSWSVLPSSGCKPSLRHRPSVWL